MPRFEYRVIPAPRKGNRVKGLKSTEDRFAATLADLMNEAGREGWEYVRSDTLPVDERQGLTGHSTSWQTMLVFRRTLAESAASGLVPLEVVPRPPAPQPPPVDPAPAPAPPPGPVLRAPTGPPEASAPQITPTRD